MKSRLLYAFRFVQDRHHIVTLSASDLYVVDRANDVDGDVEISAIKPVDINSVHLENQPLIQVCFDGFKKNALPQNHSTYSKQCECVLFPENCNTDEWVLFIETKYAEDATRAHNPKANYPNKMVAQIKKTVRYFRDKSIVPEDKVVYAIVSFPNLVEDFNSWVFPLVKPDGKEEDIMDVLLEDKIIIRATNHAVIMDSKLVHLS